jgi:7,8-dihydroneopterin aldolase/epimerase/oxygenase
MTKKSSTDTDRQSEDAAYDHLDFADTIRIRRIRVLGKHGVTDRERSVLRPLIVDVEITADLTTAQHSDNIVDTVNYSTVHKLVMQIVETHSYKLLESLAGAILDALFEDRRVLAARLRIGKPERLDGATPSITLARKNPSKR